MNNSVANFLLQISDKCETSVSIAGEIPCYTLSENDQQNIPGGSDWACLEIFGDEVLVTSPEQQPQTVSPTTEEMTGEQPHDSHCEKPLRKINERADIPFITSPESVLVRRVEAKDQIVVPEAICARVLYMVHYTASSTHSGSRRM